MVVLWTMILGAAIPVLLVANRPAWVRTSARVWCRGTLMGLKWIVGLDHEVLGKQNVLSTPALYVCNHQSAWETFAAGVLIPDVAIVAKAELLRYPIFGWYLKHSPVIVIDRSDGARAMRNMMRQAKEAVAEGRSVLIYGEGTRCGLDEHQPFKDGVVALYRLLRIPAVPMAVNSGAFWNDKTLMKRSGTISVSFLSPIDPGQDGREFKQVIQKLVHDEKDRLLEMIGDRG